jgi:hypothetical protein
MFVSCVCCQIEVSATSLSLVERSPTDCGASLCVIKKPRERGCHSPRWTAEPEIIIIIIIIISGYYWIPWLAYTHYALSLCKSNWRDDGSTMSRNTSLFAPYCNISISCVWRWVFTHLINLTQREGSTQKKHINWVMQYSTAYCWHRMVLSSAPWLILTLDIHRIYTVRSISYRTDIFK